MNNRSPALIPRLWRHRREFSRLLLVVAAGMIVVGCGRVDPRWKSRTSRAPAPESDGLDELRAAVRNDSKSVDKRVHLARAYAARERLREAAEEFRAAARSDPHNIDAVMGLRQVMMILEYPNSNLGLALKALLLDPSGSAALDVLQEASKVLDTTASQQSNNYAVLLSAGLCHMKLKNWDEAEKYFRMVASLAPYTFSARLLLGNLYLQRGELEEAALEFRQFVQEQRSNPAGHEALASVRWSQGQRTEALDEYLEVIRLRPNWAPGYLQAGRLCVELKKYDDAIEYFQGALKLEPTLFAARFGVAETQMMQGAFAEAITAYELLQKEFPNSATILNNLAILYGRNKDLDKALSLARQAGKLESTNPLILDTVGWLSQQTGRTQEALTLLQEAGRLAPTHGLIHYHLGKVLLAAGRRRDGVAELRAALAQELPESEKQDATGLVAAP